MDTNQHDDTAKAPPQGYDSGLAISISPRTATTCPRCGHPVHDDRFECGKTSPSSLGVRFLNICGCEHRDDSVDPDYEAALAEYQKGLDRAEASC